MKLSLFIICLAVFSVAASESYSQSTKLSLDLRNVSINNVLREIEDQSEFRFFYSEDIDTKKTISVKFKESNINEILDEIFKETPIVYKIVGRQVALFSETGERMDLPGMVSQQPVQVNGKITDPSGQPLPGVTVVVKGTVQGTVTNADGDYSLTKIPENGILLFSFVGMKSQEIPVEGKTTINIVMEEEAIGIEEVVAVGYGTMKKSDLTGSVVRADVASFRESPNVSVVQALQGSVAGLNIDQINQSGGEPDILIRGKSSISGELTPLVVVDNIIYRGNLIDLNPNDIESIDVLKDASAAAIYGSQATNGVILITTTKSGGIEGKPIIKYSGYYSLQNPIRELTPPGLNGFYKQTEESDIFNSRTENSGYLEVDPDWDITGVFSTTEEIDAYNDGRSIDWYNALTNNNMHTQSHNLSLANKTKYSNYLISLGYTDQEGYLLNEDYSRLNARINIDNNVTNWLTVGIQSFATVSDYSGLEATANDRYSSPYATAYDENGELIQIVAGNVINPFIKAKADDLDKRVELFGNIYANIEIPYVKGLSYRVNFANNYRTVSGYYFKSYESNFEGEGSKTETIGYDWSMDHILSFKRTYKDIHKFDVTFVYGVEKRKENYTQAISSSYSSQELGYNSLQIGDSGMQETYSGAWEESSLYTMGRIFYGLKNKYLFTGTVRRDGFSGFSEENKFGVFPSMSFAWVLSEESFIPQKKWLDNLKLRASYGTVGNRTIGRYETLATISGGYSYIDSSDAPAYTQSISSLANSSLKWETTTGINAGFDFGLFRRVIGSVEYYNNNTKDLLYEVDIPGISGFENFTDNLGRLHNHGLEISITTTNIKETNFEWTSTFNFSRNRNELKELLGYDNDGNGKEDDLVSEGLFIGESLDAIYTYKIDGKWQLTDDIPSGYDVGAHKVVDHDGSGAIDTDDRTIIGYRDPSYRFSIRNTLQYKNWSLKFFVNSIQGGKNHYLSEDNFLDYNIMNSEMHFRYIFPEDVGYWTPENPDARYQRPGISVSDGLEGELFAQRNFIRLQDVSLSYNFPKKIIEKAQLHNLSVYVSGKNLATITKWKGWDPETGETITRDGLPVIKSFTVGVNVEF